MTYVTPNYNHNTERSGNTNVTTTQSAVSRRSPAPSRPQPPIPSNNLTPLQSKPRNKVLDHPAGPDLLQYALDGCPVDCGNDWTLKQLEAAILNGAHSSANIPEAAEACKKEALERVKEGSCRLVNWIDIKENFPRSLKIFP
jgi:hypothetical protein